jgi:muramidase (phage lysozyme)
MDRSIPASAARLLDFIGGIEAHGNYRAIFGFKQDKLSKPVTSMTVDEVIAGKSMVDKRSSATGRYQFMRNTLKSLKADAHLTGSELMTPDLQDRLGFELLKRRGWEQFEAGKLGLTAFVRNLAMEWASIPVLRRTKGAKRIVERGQSYYAGDGLNNSLVTAEQVLAVLTPEPATPVVPTAPTTPTPAPSVPTTGEVVMPDNTTVTPTQIPGTKKVILPVPQITQNPLTSKAVIGTIVSVLSFLSAIFPQYIPATLAPIVDSGATVASGVIFAALALYGRFTAEGPLKFIMGGGMSEVSALRDQMLQMQQVIEQLHQELAAKKTT